MLTKLPFEVLFFIARFAKSYSNNFLRALDLEFILISTNIAGSGTMLYDAFNAQRYGLSPFESLLGPAPQHLSRMISALGTATTGEPRALSTHLARSIPFVSAVFPRKTSEISDTIESFIENYYGGGLEFRI